MAVVNTDVDEHRKGIASVVSNILQLWRDAARNSKAHPVIPSNEISTVLQVLGPGLSTDLSVLDQIRN